MQKRSFSLGQLKYKLTWFLEPWLQKCWNATMFNKTTLPRTIFQYSQGHVATFHFAITFHQSWTSPHSCLWTTQMEPVSYPITILSCVINKPVFICWLFQTGCFDYSTSFPPYLNMFQLLEVKHLNFTLGRNKNIMMQTVHCQSNLGISCSYKISDFHQIILGDTI